MRIKYLEEVPLTGFANTLDNGAPFFMFRSNTSPLYFILLLIYTGLSGSNLYKHKSPKFVSETGLLICRLG